MASKTKKPRAWFARTKKQRGKIVAARVKEIDESKRKGSRDGGYTRADLEALRDGRS